MCITPVGRFKVSNHFSSFSSTRTPELLPPVVSGSARRGYGYTLKTGSFVIVYLSFHPLHPIHHLLAWFIEIERLTSLFPVFQFFVSPTTSVFFCSLVTYRISSPLLHVFPFLILDLSEPFWDSAKNEDNLSCRNS